MHNMMTDLPTHHTQRLRAQSIVQPYEYSVVGTFLTAHNSCRAFA